MKTVYAFFADGMEEVEALMIIDLMRRSHKIDVVTVSITEELVVEGSHKIKVFADKTIDEIDFEKGDCIFLPGGLPGTTNLARCKELTEQILKYNEEGKLLAAICAAPSVFSHLGILKNVNATSYPSFAEEMDCNEYGGSVVTDANFVTGKGLGVALPMGLELVRILSDKKTSEDVADKIQYDNY